MTVKWSAELDQALFILVLDVMSIKIGPGDAQKIIDRWPTNAGNKPSVRSITEHIGHLRKNITKNLNIGGAATMNTPKKSLSRSLALIPGTMTPYKASNKRPRFDDNVNLEADDDDYPAHQNNFKKRATSVKPINYIIAISDEEEEGEHTITVKPESIEEGSEGAFSSAMGEGRRRFAAAVVEDDETT